MPGELVAFAARGRHLVATDIAKASADRIAPPCPHFGACGGCTVQHLADAAYAAWKGDILRRALQRAGYADPPVATLRRSAPGTRRRMDLAVRRMPAGIVVGLHERHGAAVVDLQTCLVLAPVLVALIPALRQVLASIAGLRREGSAIVNLVEDGPDLLLRTDGALSTGDRTRLGDFCRRHGLVRIAHAPMTGDPEPVCVLRPSRLAFSGVAVSCPPGAFLQATPAGEAAIVAAVMENLPRQLPRRAWIADLYAGLGTLSFALAAAARVQAWERDGPALAALRMAANMGLPGNRVMAVPRDLVRQPLQPAELAGAAAVVLDPPWAGAAAQVAILAAPIVIYVSCNPATLARDAAVLRARGYAITAATPIDQFLWSSRLESVVAFRARA